jgi:hypothetical protein
LLRRSGKEWLRRIPFKCPGFAQPELQVRHSKVVVVKHRQRTRWPSWACQKGATMLQSSTTMFRWARAERPPRISAPSLFRELSQNWRSLAPRPERQKLIDQLIAVTRARFRSSKAAAGGARLRSDYPLQWRG